MTTQLVTKKVKQAILWC